MICLCLVLNTLIQREKGKCEGENPEYTIKMLPSETYKMLMTNVQASL